MQLDKPNRQFQFSLRSLFVIMTFCAVVASLVAMFPSFFIEDFFLFLLFWLIAYLPISLILCGPIWWFSRKRVSYWRKSDFLVLFVPYLTWVILLIIDSSGKSLSNLCEIFYFGLASVFAPITRIVAPKSMNPIMTAYLGLFAVCLIAVMLWAFVPGLPE